MDDEIALGLKQIAAIMKVAFSDQIEASLAKIVTTADRKRVWAAIDGAHTSAQISAKLRIPKRTVDFFVSTAADAGLVLAPRGRPPARLVDLVPIEWRTPQEKPKKSKSGGGESGPEAV